MLVQLGFIDHPAFSLLFKKVKYTRAHENLATYARFTGLQKRKWIIIIFHRRHYAWLLWKKSRDYKGMTLLLSSVQSWRAHIKSRKKDIYRKKICVSFRDQFENDFSWSTVFENLSKSLILQHGVTLQNETFLGSFQTFCTEETLVHSKISTHSRYFFCSLSCTIFLEKTYGWSMCVHNFFLEFTKTLDSAQFRTIQRENPDLQKKDDR